MRSPRRPISFPLGYDFFKGSLNRLGLGLGAQQLLSAPNLGFIQHIVFVFASRTRLSGHREILFEHTSPEYVHAQGVLWQELERASLGPPFIY